MLNKRTRAPCQDSWPPAPANTGEATPPSRPRYLPSLSSPKPPVKKKASTADLSLQQDSAGFQQDGYILCPRQEVHDGKAKWQGPSSTDSVTLCSKVLKETDGLHLLA